MFAVDEGRDPALARKRDDIFISEAPGKRLESQPLVQQRKTYSPAVRTEKPTPVGACKFLEFHLHPLNFLDKTCLEKLRNAEIPKCREDELLSLRLWRKLPGYVPGSFRQLEVNRGTIYLLS